MGKAANSYKRNSILAVYFAVYLIWYWNLESIHGLISVSRLIGICFYSIFHMWYLFPIYLHFYSAVLVLGMYIIISQQHPCHKSQTLTNIELSNLIN